MIQKYELQTMANELVTVQHSYDGLLKFILPKDTVTADLEVMTLTGVHTYKKDKNNIRKQDSSPGTRKICLLQNFWER